MELTRTRWKGKGFAAIADANPMSMIVVQLQSSLERSTTHAMLSGCDILLEVAPETGELLDQACFGQKISNAAEKGNQWFQLGPEEAFYMHYALQCLTVLAANGRPMSEADLWDQMKSRRRNFPEIYTAYARIRSKNWVVRSGTQYGVDFMAYRHHPALVHSEYAVLVLSESSKDTSRSRLGVWSDLQGSLRVSRGVAKTLLVVSVSVNGDASSPTCLKKCSVDERTIVRWVPEENREEFGKENRGK